VSGNLIQAARSALDGAMREEPGVVVLGEDVASGGPFGLTKKLADSYGTDRVRNTPISEGAIMGAAVGLALAGGRPFVDLMFNDFVTAASDQLMNHAAKVHFMSGGAYSVPLTVWTVGGAGTRWGAQHSQRLDGWLAQVPGLKVLSPASPAMTRVAVAEALADPDPVVVFVDRALLYDRRPLPRDDGSPWTARVVQKGDALTVAATGRLVHLAMEASRGAGIDAEVVDVQRLAPLEVGPVVESLDRTSRLLVLHDEAAMGAMSALLVEAVYEQGFWSLDAPIKRLTAPATPVPAAAELEDAHVIGGEDIVRAMNELLAWA
jgi:pyruvate/2-oxoglutarate/acetoin dehydrogenase E1 component